MAKLRNKTDNTLETKVLGRSYITEPDGILEVTDDVYLAHGWPDAIWDDVEVPSSPDDDDKPKPVHHPRKTAASKENV